MTDAEILELRNKVKTLQTEMERLEDKLEEYKVLVDVINISFAERLDILSKQIYKLALAMQQLRCLQKEKEPKKQQRERIWIIEIK